MKLGTKYILNSSKKCMLMCICILFMICFANCKRRGQHSKTKKYKETTKHEHYKHRDPQKKHRLRRQLAKRTHTLSASRNSFVVNIPTALRIKIDDNFNDHECFNCFAKLSSKLKRSEQDKYTTTVLTENDVIFGNRNNHVFAFNLTHIRLIKYSWKKQGQDKDSLQDSSSIQNEHFLYPQFAHHLAHTDKEYFYKEIQTIPTGIAVPENAEKNECCN